MCILINLMVWIINTIKYFIEYQKESPLMLRQAC